MQITATELKANLGKYLALAEVEDVRIIKNGRETVTISNTHKDRIKAMQSIFGIIKPDLNSIDELRNERLTKKLGYELWKS